MCITVVTSSDGLDWSVSMARTVAEQEAAGCIWNKAEPPRPVCVGGAYIKVSALASPQPQQSAGPDRQKMLSFPPCGTIRANSIKIPSK